MRSIRQYGLAAAMSAMLLATGSGAAADPGEATHVDSLIAVRGTSAIAVSGKATFVDAPVQVGDDPVGDALISGPSGGAAPLGDDLTTATIVRPDPLGSTLMFTLGIANQPSGLNGVPETVHYNWDLSVDGGEVLTLQAIRSAQGTNTGSVDPVFQILRCVEGFCDPELAVEVPGKMADGVVEWQVPMSEINAKSKSVIAQAGAVVSTLGASGQVWFVNFGGDEAFVDDYTVPGPTVQLGIAPAGTPAEQVELTGSATVQSTGAFTGTLPTPTQSGSYVVVAKACNGTGNCGLATTNITV